jgi:hypothetical protein
MVFPPFRVQTKLPQRVAVGMPVTQHPPHRSRRAALPHRAPASGRDAQAPESACRTRLSACDRRPRRSVRLLFCSATIPLASSLPSTFSAGPVERPLFEGFLGTMKLSDALWPCITVVPLVGSPCGPGCDVPGQTQGLPGPAQHVSVHARGLRPRQVCPALTVPVWTVEPSACEERVGT